MIEGPKPYLHALHAFRGVAILTIVMAHAAGLVLIEYGRAVGANDTTPVITAINEVLWHDSTVFFALISGVLFSAVLASRGWRAFFRSKALNVLLPYAVMTAVFTFVTYRVSVPGEFLHIRVVSPTGYVSRFLENLAHGTALMPYWYIPLLACLFALTPIVWFLSRRFPAGIALLAALPLVVSRTGVVFSAQSVVYFLGVYAIGVYVGMDYRGSISRLRAALPGLVVAALTTSVLLLAWNLNGWPVGHRVSVVESLFYVQKLSIAALLLLLLGRFRHDVPAWLALCARLAFAIFFLHIIFLRMATDLVLGAFNPPLSGIGLQAIILLVFAAGTIASVGASLVVKRLLGRHSRRVIGG